MVFFLFGFLKKTSQTKNVLRRPPMCVPPIGKRRRVATGQRVISTDEMTGVQALERAAPGLPLRPGKVERREFEYIRHGKLSFMINFDVVSGKVICPSVWDSAS